MLTERRGAVVHLRMNRPEVLNVLDRDLALALADSLTGARDDSSVRAVVLSGAGRSFMAGADLTVFRDDPDSAPELAGWLMDRFHAAIRAIKAMPKPVIAVIQGPVAGGGIGIALACDFVIAADDVSLLSAYTKLGTNPDGGTTWSLTKLLGPRRAMEFMLLNERLDARTAMQLGLVNAVVPAASLIGEAFALAERLAAGSVGATAAVKRLVGSAVTGAFDAQLDLEKTSFTANAATADFREGIAAFFERRPARFG